MSVLYDEPGPRSKRLTIILSVLFGLAALAVLYFFVYKPLDARHQFSMVKWGPLIDPNNEYFGQIWTRLEDGALATLKAAGLAIVSGLTFGSVLAIVRLQLRALSLRRYAGLAAPVGYGLRAIVWLLNFISRFAVEVLRGIPVIITIFFAWRLLGGDTLIPLIVGLALYNGVVIAEIIRSGMEGLPKGQREAGESIGLTSFQTTRLVLLPQAVRVMLPALISQIVVILKDTALGGIIIGYQDLVNTGKQLAQALPQTTFDQESYNPIQMFAVIGVMFIVVNYLLSKLAQFTERRLSRRHAPNTMIPAGDGRDFGGGV